MEDARLLVERLCQCWAGGLAPLIPLLPPDAEGKRCVDPRFREFLISSEIDEFVTGTVAEPDDIVAVAKRGMRHASHGWDYPLLVMTSHEDPQVLRPVETVVVPTDNDWFIAYLATLGAWSEEPNRDLLSRIGARPDLLYADLWPAKRLTPQSFGLADLLARVSDSETLPPRAATAAHLTMRVVRAGDENARDSVVPDRWHDARRVGPNVIVVYEPGSIADLALLWALRTAYALPPGLPLGVPVTAATPDLLQSVFTSEFLTPMGLRDAVVGLVSASVNENDLRRLVADIDPHFRPYFRVHRPEHLLRDPGAPHRPSVQTPLWVDGTATVPAFTPDDLELFRPLRSILQRPELHLTVSPAGRRLPRIATLRGSRWAPPNYVGGVCRADVNLRNRSAAEVSWPASWTVLQALAKEQGLQAKPSIPGAAAAALIDAVGGLAQIRWLAVPSLTLLLQRMAEATGMAWMRQRWARLAGQAAVNSADPEGSVSRLEAAGREMAVVTAGDDSRTVPFDDFRTALDGRTAASAWLHWAEEAGLVVRGASAGCGRCGLKSWRPVAALAPPIACPGCGRDIERPYDVDLLRFTYRLGEPLRRAIAEDSFWHVLACRYFYDLLGSKYLLGTHPGVEFSDLTTGEVVAEADVILVAHDGTIALGEVKRHATGVTDHDLSVMGRLASRLGAAWTFLACSDSGASVADVYRQLRRDMPATPRYPLTADHLLDPLPHFGIGQDPFSWSPSTAAVNADRARALIDEMARYPSPDTRHFGTDQALLSADDD